MSRNPPRACGSHRNWRHPRSQHVWRNRFHAEWQPGRGVGKDRQDQALAQSGARTMVMRGRTMEGHVYVDPPALSEQAVQKGLWMAVAYVQTLPPKAKGKTKQRKEKR